ncbi:MULTISPECIES: AAA family ATPase [unclassified Pseudoclavibacter]|uniref:AAA family ATPase n=1 Tax=unclassified Pseudoclavibacter TaxID=2615177 RepID=UPI000CE77937|nr:MULTISPECIES: AAA family ATPase [unclassified Pseudoclavibacter]PPF35277.1 ATP-binding protein [Pseudoclavibacter sp. AY1H1]PPF78227.1 ATP-binding protein [Pseudoclavibacter sp. Z016]
MLELLAIENYRSIKSVTLGLERLNVITGANGSGKSNLYRALRLLHDIIREGALSSLAMEGGLRAVIHAGKRSRGEPVTLKLGLRTSGVSFATDLGMPSPEQVQNFAIDLGIPIISDFPFDPVVKSELVWASELLRPSTTLVERRANSVRVRDADFKLVQAEWSVREAESMLATLADPSTAPELYALRESARGWRFLDYLRTDAAAPARLPSPATFTPVLPDDGSRLPAALATVQRIGQAGAFHDAIDAAFPGSRVSVEEDESGMAKIVMSQPGLARPLDARELSDGTLRMILLATALLSPRMPELLVLNEPEASLHPSLLPTLAGLIRRASEQTQVIVVTHSQSLVDGLRDDANVVELEKEAGATSIRGKLQFDGPLWVWPKR